MFLPAYFLIMKKISRFRIRPSFMNEFMSFYKFGAREGALWLESVTIQINSVEQYIRVMLFDSRCFTNYKKGELGVVLVKLEALEV